MVQWQQSRRLKKRLEKLIDDAVIKAENNLTKKFPGLSVRAKLLDLNLIGPGGPLLPLLARFLVPGQQPSPDEIAAVWDGPLKDLPQFNPLEVATCFHGVFKDTLRADLTFGRLVDSQDIRDIGHCSDLLKKKIEEHDQRLVDHDAGIHAKLDQLMTKGKSHEWTVPRQATPPLPMHYIERSREVEKLKGLLLGNGPSVPGVLVVTAVHGMGGIGKSVLAVAVARGQKFISDNFPDGVLWTTLGQKPEVLTELTRWIKASGDSVFRPTNVPEASDHMASRLYARSCLVVVDDAWRAQDVEPFLIGGPSCRVLVTTREAWVADAIEAQRVLLGVMSEDEALALYQRKIANTNVTFDRSKAKRLAERVGYLPLAIDLTADSVKRRGWNRVLEEIESEIVRLDKFDRLAAKRESDEERMRRHSLNACFNLSLRILDSEVLTCFIKLGVIAEDAIITVPMVSTLWAIDPNRAEEILDDLLDRSLLQPGPESEAGKPLYRQHDLLHDLARNLIGAPVVPTDSGGIAGLSMDLAKAHAQLLDSYWAQAKNGLWHTLEDDGYIHEHLVWHLEQAGQPMAIHELLMEECALNGTRTGANGWYERREALGQTAGYLKDLERASILAADAVNKEIESGDLAPSVGLAVRYALMSASLNCLGAEMPMELPAALVRAGIWEPSQALFYIQRMNNFEDICAATTQLAMACSGHDRSEIIEEVFKRVETVIKENALDIYTTKSIAVDMVLVLSGQDRLRAIGLALDSLKKIAAFRDRRPQIATGIRADPEQLNIVIDQDNQLIATSLHRLAPYLDGENLMAALAMANDLPLDDNRPPVMAALAERLTGEKKEKLLNQAIEAADRLESGLKRDSALARMARPLASSGRLDLVAEVLKSALIDYDSMFNGILLNLIEYLTPVDQSKAVDRALILIAAILDKGVNYFGWESLVRYADSGQLEKALKLARSNNKPDARAKSLLGMVEYGPQNLKPELRAEALTKSKKIVKRTERAAIIVRAAAGLPPEEAKDLLLEALGIVLTINDSDDLNGSLVRLSPLVGPDLFPEAILTADNIEPASNRAYCLFEVARNMTGEQQNKLAVASAQVAREMDTSPPSRAWQTAKRNVYDSERNKLARAYALTNAASLLSPPESAELMIEAFNQALDMSSDWTYQAKTFDYLAWHMKEPVGEEFIQAAVGAVHKSKQVAELKALASLSNHVAEPDRSRLILTALAAVETLDQDFQGRDPDQTRSYIQQSRDNALAEILSRLKEPIEEAVQAKALEMVEAMPESYRKVRALAALAKFSPAAEKETLIQSALAIAEGIDAARAIRKSLQALVPVLYQAHMVRALKLARRADKPYHRAIALLEVALRLGEGEPRADVLREIVESLGKVPPRPAELNKLSRFELIAGLSPHLVKLNAPRFADLLRLALQDLTQSRRDETIKSFPQLIFLIKKVGGQGAADETFKAIEDVGHWWP